MGKNLKRQQQNKGAHIAAPETQSKPANSETPVFCLHYLKGAFCVTQCESDDKAAFVDRLHTLSKMTWQQIQVSPRHGLGHEKIEQNAIRTGLPPHVTKDVTLLAFRFNGKKPMVGYRSGRVFHILFVDHNFTLYDHGG